METIRVPFIANFLLVTFLTVSGFNPSLFASTDEPFAPPPTAPVPLADEASEASQRARFVKSDKPGMLIGLLEFPAYSFYLGAPDVNGVAYVPNFSPRVGGQIRWKDYGLSLTFGLPLPPEEIERRGQSEQSNFILTRYGRDYGLDLYYQHYRGFYVSSPLTEIKIDKPSRYPQLPDAEIRNYGLNYYQSLDSEKYSLSASFDLEEIQTIHGGAWILVGFYNHLEMSLGDVFIKGSDPNSLQALPNLKSGVFDTAGGGGGYGHTWVWNGWYLAAQGTAGVGVQMQKIGQAMDGQETQWSPALKANLNLSAGRNHKDNIFGGKVLVDSLLSSVDSVHVYSSLVNGVLFYGMRF